MPEKSAFTFHYNFYLKPKVVLEDATISDETKNKLHALKQDNNDIGCQHSSDIGLIKTDSELTHVASKAYLLPLKHHILVKKEIKNLLEAGLMKRSMSPYAAPITVVPRKCKPGALLAETKRLSIDYRELNRKIPKVNTT